MTLRSSFLQIVGTETTVQFVHQNINLLIQLINVMFRATCFCNLSLILWQIVILSDLSQNVCTQWKLNGRIMNYVQLPHCIF